MDICEHMEVVDANGQHVGIVEKVEGDRIKLTEKDALDPQHLFLDKSQIAGIEGNKVNCYKKYRQLQPELSSLGERSLAPKRLDRAAWCASLLSGPADMINDQFCTRPSPLRPRPGPS